MAAAQHLYIVKWLLSGSELTGALRHSKPDKNVFWWGGRGNAIEGVAQP